MASVTSSTTATSYKRITGLATGLDTDNLVKQMMQPYKLKVTKAQQERDLLVFKQDMYREIIKNSRDFYSKYMDLSKPDSLLLSKNYGTSKFTSTGSNVTAEGLAGAKLGTYTLDVKQTAKVAQYSFGTGTNEVNKFSDLKGKNLTLNISGKKVDINLSDTLTDDEAVQFLNQTLTTNGMNAKFTKSDLTGNIYLETTKTGETAYIGIESFTSKTDVKLENMSYSDLNQAIKDGQEVKFSINGSDEAIIDFSGITTTDESERKTAIIEKLAAAFTEKGATVKVENDDISIMNGSGDGKALKLSIGANVYESIGETQGKASLLKDSNGDSVSSIKGTNAIYDVTDSYGNKVTGKTSDSNEFVVDNVKFKVTGIGSATITGNQDSSGLIEKIKGFVNDYNKLISDINTKVSEKKQYKYEPLTEEQRDSMTDDQIEKWDAKVKEGLLKRDSDLTNIMSQLRQAFNSKVEGTSISLRSIGIDFTNDMSKSGQIEIDETKLTAALETSADQIVKLFTQTPASGITDKQEKYNNSGIFQRVKNVLNDSVMSSSSSFLKKVGYVGTSTYTDNEITKNLLSKERKIEEMERSLSDREEKFYQKFANLETIMNKYNAQMSSLSSMFGTSS